jgi:hypothetical protein
MDACRQFVHQALPLAVVTTKLPDKPDAVSMTESSRADAQQSGFGLWSQWFMAKMGMHADLG